MGQYDDAAAKDVADWVQHIRDYCGAHCADLPSKSRDEQDAEMWREHADDLVEKILTLTKERDRLQRGEFTSDELQNLCHNLSTVDRKAFFDGCDAEQEKLFGTCRTHELEKERDELRESLAPFAKWGRLIERRFSDEQPLGLTTEDHGLRGVNVGAVRRASTLLDRLEGKEASE